MQDWLSRWSGDQLKRRTEMRSTVLCSCGGTVLTERGDCHTTDGQTLHCWSCSKAWPTPTVLWARREGLTIKLDNVVPMHRVVLK